MGKSQETFGKKEKEKKRLKKRKEKAEKREERKANASGGGLENMMAYVNERGEITDTPQDPVVKKEEIKAEDIEIGVPKRIEEEEDPIKSGRVEFYNDQKGFGFIKDLKSVEKYFFHVNNVDGEIKEGNLVNFELEKGPKGWSAVRVKQDKG